MAAVLSRYMGIWEPASNTCRRMYEERMRLSTALSDMLRILFMVKKEAQAIHKRGQEFIFNIEEIFGVIW